MGNIPWPLSLVGIGKLPSVFALLCYASSAGKTLLLCSVLCQLAWLCCVCSVCIWCYCRTNSPTEPRCDCPQCFILEKLNPPTKSDLVQKKTDLRIFGPDKNLLSITLYYASICSYVRRNLLLCQHNLPVPTPQSNFCSGTACTAICIHTGWAFWHVENKTIQ